MNDAHEVIEAWQSYFEQAPDWQTLVEDVDSHESGNGTIYQLQNPLERPGESLAIIDMRALELSDPHLHANGETEINLVLQGTGRIAIGSEITELLPGVAVVIPPNVVHIVLPADDLVLASVMTPPFNSDNYLPVPADDPAVAATIVRLRAI